MPSVGKPAPAFRLSDQDGIVRSLSDYKGKWLVLYFYPKDDTPGCTMEAQVLGDSLPKFKKRKVEVVGVSADSVTSHKKFCDKIGIPFPLLSDESKKMLNTYKVWQEKQMMGRTYMGIVRTTFVINPEGKIAKIYENVKPAGHAEELLKDIHSLLTK